jgi:hypothetical protein
MMTRGLWFMVVVVVVGCSSPDTAPRVSAELSALKKLDTLNAAMHASQDRRDTFVTTGKILGSTYEQLFTPAARAAVLARGDAKDLAALFDAANTATFYTLDQTHARQALEAYDALVKRGQATTEQGDIARMVAFKTRLFERTGLSLHDESAGRVPTELTVNGDTATRRAVSLSGSQIVVVSGCHFAVDARTAIEADPALAAVFAKAHWLVPQEGGTLDDARDPEFAIAYNRDEWPMLDTWGSPTFYFLRDGTVVKKVVGWHKDDVAINKASLRDGVKLLGL